jgi:hypothetical protein
MTTKPRKPTKTRPVTGKKVAGRKRIPKLADMRLVDGSRRYTVRDADGAPNMFVICDRKSVDEYGLYTTLYERIEGRCIITRKFHSRVAAWRHLRTTTTEATKYRLWMLNQALDRSA